MMRGIWKKVVSMLLCLAMALQLVPASALAADVTGGGTGNYNDEVFAVLEDYCDSEEEAEYYYSALEDYGFLDESGNVVDSWEITMDGEEVTLEEIRELLDDPDCDKSRTVVVDGTSVTLEDLETMIEIEDYISYLEETYFSPHEWSEEQLASLDDLVNQIKTVGIDLVDTDTVPEDGSWTPSAAVDHDVRLDVEVTSVKRETVVDPLASSADLLDDVYAYSTITFTVTPTKAQTQDITFTWRTVDGSASATKSTGIQSIVIPAEYEGGYASAIALSTARERLADGYYDLESPVIVNGEEMTFADLAEWIAEYDAITEETITIPAGSTEPVEFSVYVSDIQGRVDGTATFLVQIYDVTNALIEDIDENGEETASTRWEQVVTVQSEEDFRYRIQISDTGYVQGDFAFVRQEHKSPFIGSDSYNYQFSWGNWDLFDPCMPGGDHKTSTRLNGNMTTIHEDFTAVTFDLTKSNAYVEGTDKLGCEISVGELTLNRPLPYSDSRYINDVTTDSYVASDSEFYGEKSKWNISDLAGDSLDITTKLVTSQGVTSWSDVTTFEYNYPPTLFAAYETVSIPAVTSVVSGGVDRSEKSLSVVLNESNFGVEKWSSSAVSSGWNTYFETYWCVFCPEVSKFNVTLDIWDTNQAATATLYAPSGTYYAGQTIPITAAFDYPMEITEDMYITVNGRELHPVEAGSMATACTFLYEVQEIDSARLYLVGDDDGGDGTVRYSLDGTGANELAVGVTLDEDNSDLGNADIEAEGTSATTSRVALQTPDKSAVITGISVAVTSEVTEPVLHVKVDITDDGKLTTWLTNELIDGLDELSGTYYTSTMMVLYGGEEYPLYTTAESITGGELYADIPIDLNINSLQQPITRGVELLIDDKIDMTWYASTEQAPAVFLAEDDIDAQITVTQSDGSPYAYTDENYTIWLQDQPGISASLTLGDGAWSFGDTEATTIYKSDGSLADPDADFVWWIGDEDGNPDSSIANIDANGKITATGSVGTAVVYLTALNGDNKTDAENEREVTAVAYQMAVLADDETATAKRVEYLSFDVGLTPFLYIPYDEISSVSGQDVTVYWTSNLCDKNESGFTYFNVSLICNGTGETIRTESVYGTADDPVSGYTIDGDLLIYDYNSPENNVYTFTVSSWFEGVKYSATAVISLQPSPAVITLDALDTYYISDTVSSVRIGWDIESFEWFEGVPSGEFELLITKGDGDFVYTTNDPEENGMSADGSYRGGYTLNIDDVIATSDDATSYREIYTVTVAAKNGGDSTWSYDSFLLYVYDKDALDIWINGESADGTTLSNVKAISEMTQDEIIALNRDINLKAMVSVNYGEYAWSELADQMAWASSDSSVAPVAYQQGTLYENIEHFTYTSYRPTTEFGITGLADGEVTISAEHTLTGISDSVTVDVERLDNQLYLFQCYPQVATTLFYTNGDGEEKTVTSDENGAAAIYEPSGIASDVYFQTEYNGYTYLGTFYNASLKSGEGDWTMLERYPCNNITLHRAAYAYMYLKTPDGEPYVGDVTVRGGVYVDGEYVETGLFDYNGEQNGDATQAGDEDYTLTLGEDGKLEITMDQTQWGLDTGAVKVWNSITYIFEVSMGNDETEYYPMFITIDAAANEEEYVENGEAIVSFRENTGTGKHAFIAGEAAGYGQGELESMLDANMNIGPSTKYPVTTLYIVAMWWGEDEVSDDAELQLFTEDGRAIGTAEDKHEIYQETYPFIDERTTVYTVTFDEESLESVLEPGDTVGLYLEYYRDGRSLSRREDLTLTLINMIGLEEPVYSTSIKDEIQDMGAYIGTDASEARSLSGLGDVFVAKILDLVAGDSYTEKDDSHFKLCLSPTPDSSKFVGLIEVAVGSLNDSNMSGAYGDSGTSVFYNPEDSIDNDLLPGLSELLTVIGVRTKDEYKYGDFRRVQSKKAVRNFDFGLSGNMEVLIYYDFNQGKWMMEALDGGFGVGGGINFTLTYNVPGMPLTASFTAGGTMEVQMDAVSVAYENKKEEYSVRGTDYLTELRIYLYLKFFAGIGIDYAVVAAKIGIYGQVDVDMRFQWLNRPTGNSNGLQSTAYEGTNETSLSGQKFKIDGTAGIEIYAKIFFVKTEIVLYSYTYNFLTSTTNDWNTVQNIWNADEAALEYAFKNLDEQDFSNLSASGVPMMSLNLAPTLLDVSYLKNGSTWGSGIKTMSLDETNGVDLLNENSYEFANPLVTDDGSIVAFLGVPDSYTGQNLNDIDISDISAMFAIKSGDTYAYPAEIDDGTDEELAGYGDDELALAGDGSFAVAAWTRQMTDIAKDDGAVLTEEDERMMLDSTDICVSVYDGGSWTTTRIENGGTDLAPVVATNGKDRAVVAWRSVASYDGVDDISDFNKSDMILYKTYDRNTGEWSETQTLYNGTSGNVKGLTAEMLGDGTAAVAYTLDTDDDTDTITDREIVYAVINSETGEVDRNVRATTDSYLDENPQLTTVKIGGEERFLLGWYTEQGADMDNAEGLDGNSGAGNSETLTDTSDLTSDIRLIDFDAAGNATQQMPDSISSAATSDDVSITSDFAFSKGADTIDDLSIVWVERAEGEASKMDEDTEGEGSVTEGTTEAGDVERDVLKAVKFYTYGEDSAQISFTSAIDVAEMQDATLIDSFDTYTADGETIKAVIMGTTYGADGLVEKTSTGASGNEITYYVPSTTTSMYTATETYENTIYVPAFLADYDTVKLGAKTQLWFNIENTGIDPITEMTIAVGDDPDSVTTYTDLDILPGSNLEVYADYRVPADAVRDEVFKVTAVFADGSSYTYEGDIYLNLPDLKVTDASVIREEDGERDILIKLSNKTDAALGDTSNSKVRVSFYTDSTYENEIAQGYGLDAFEITDAADLKMINEGGYSKGVTFDVERYMVDMAAAEEDVEESEALEIPDAGVNVYVMAEVVDSETDEVLAEPNSYNNYGMVTCENLKVRTGQDVTITTTLDVDEEEDEEGASDVTVTVELQNTRLTETATGNVIVTLLDEDGNILAQQQSYNGTDGLLTLGGEEKATERFTFSDITDVFTVDVQYTDMILSEEDDEIPEGLKTLLFPSLDGNISLNDFVWDDEGQAYVHDVTVDTLFGMSMIAVASDAGASITVNGETTDFYTVAKNLELTPGEDNEIRITVTNQNNVQTTYLLTVYDETVTVEGRAFWDDSDDQDGVRPESITVRLCADGEEIDSTVVTAADDWSWYFTNLPIYSDGEEILYTITQDDIDGYETTVDGYNVTNTHTPYTVDITGEKTWIDNDDQDGYRPASITIRLLADGLEVDSAEVTAEYGWSWSFTDLPKNRDGGVEIIYTVTEDAVDNYIVGYDGTDVTNTHSADQTSLTVSAAWDDDSDRDGVRPESITVQLYADGEAVDGMTLTLSAEDNWLGTFSGLDMYRDGGKQVKYTVAVTDDADGYTSAVTGDAKTGYLVTSTHEIATVDIDGSKTWDDNDNQDGKRPENIVITLRADGEAVQSAEVTEKKMGLLSRIISFFSRDDGSDAWNWNFTGLPKYRDGGVEIEYTITEDEVAGYETEVIGYDVTNIHIPAQTSVTVSMEWDDEDNLDGSRPESVTVQLCADGEAVEGGTLTLSEADGWTGTFAGLDMYRDGGIEIAYSVELIGGSDSYTSVVTGDAETGFVILGSHTPIVPGTPDEETPDEKTPGEETPDEKEPDEGVQDEDTSDEGVQDEDTSDEGVQDEGTSDEGVQDKDTSDEGVQDEDTSDEGVQDEDMSDVEIQDKDVTDEGVQDEDTSDVEIQDKDVTDEGVQDEDTADEEIQNDEVSDSETTDAEAVSTGQSVKTGDNSRGVLYGMIAMLCVALIAFSAVSSRKRRERH